MSGGTETQKGRVMSGTKRYIGIRHRIKQTAKGDAHPTEVCIVENGQSKVIKLEDEQAELDFLLGRLPVKWRVVKDGENFSAFPEHHILLGEKDKPTHVPSDYEGFKGGDVVGMPLGGSGDYFSYALARRGEEIGASVCRIPPFLLKERRGHEDTTSDAPLLAELMKTESSLFYQVYLRERAQIGVRGLLRVRIDAMKARIACEQRLRQSFVGEIFCNPNGGYPEGSLEKIFDLRKANDGVLIALKSEETSAVKKLTKAVEELPIYKVLHEEVSGLGPMIATRLICAVQDIRRFSTAPKLKKFCGVHVLPDGRFPRSRIGEICSWTPDARQALYLLADQFNRQAKAGTKWGNYLILCKKRLRDKHPVKVQIEKTVDGKKKMVWTYTDAHIHKMGIWRCLTRFVEWLFVRWWQLEQETAKATETK